MSISIKCFGKPKYYKEANVLVLNIEITNGCFFTKKDLKVSICPSDSGDMKKSIDQTITLMKKYPNVWCDTAFMLTENIVKLCNENLTDRVLWGSDYSINRWYYRDLDSKDWYLDLVKKLEESVSDTDFEKITHGNFERLFCL